MFLYPNVVDEERPSELIHYLATNRGKQMIKDRIHFLDCTNLHALPSLCCGVLCAFSVDKNQSWDLGIILQVHPSAIMITKVVPNRSNVSYIVH